MYVICITLLILIDREKIDHPTSVYICLTIYDDDDDDDDDD